MYRSTLNIGLNLVQNKWDNLMSRKRNMQSDWSYCKDYNCNSLLDIIKHMFLSMIQVNFELDKEAGNSLIYNLYIRSDLYMLRI